MSRTVLLVGGSAPHRRAIRDVLKLEGMLALEADSAPTALALLREAAFDLILVNDEVRRLALQGLFAQIKRLSPQPMVYLLPMEGTDPAQLRSMAGGASKLLDPAASPEDHAAAMLNGIDAPSEAAIPNAVTVQASVPPPRQSQPPRPLPSFPPNAVTSPGLMTPSKPAAAAPAAKVEFDTLPVIPKQPARDPAQFETLQLTQQTGQPPWMKPPPPQLTDPSIANTPPLPLWAINASGGLSEYARGVVVERGRVLDIVVAQRRGQPAVLLATPTAAFASDQGWTGELMRAATVAARVTHTNLPRIVDIGTAEEPFVATAFTPGMTLTRMIRRLNELEHGFTPEGATALVADLLGALEALHDAKLHHGSVSPRALWVTEEGSVQLLHAGVAPHVHAAERAMRGPNLPPASLEYEAPEAVIDGVIDSKSDVFAAGIIAWELIVGERLFARIDQTAIQEAIGECVIPSMDAPKPIEACVQRLLAKDPDARPKSAGAARNELLTAMKEAKSTTRKSGGVMGRLFGKKPSDAIKRLEAADPWAERAQLVKLASR